jgi:hypothetical protein
MKSAAEVDVDVCLAAAESHSREWMILCDKYLPIVSDTSIWRYSRPANGTDIEQGWKLHVSATVLSANKTFAAVASYLKRRAVLFKAPNSLQELQKLNSGLYYGYSQVGKFLTVYPRSPGEAVALARRLDRLTHGVPAPSVPFDSKFRPASNVYYRYGSFKTLEIENVDGTMTPAVRDHAGNLMPDCRYSHDVKPEWVTNPFANRVAEDKKPTSESLMETPFRVLRSFSQRGKGGVYQAVDFSVNPPRLCVIKQGRRRGEITWDGRDGAWMVKRETRVLASLRAAGVEVPAVYSSFKRKHHHYLVTEFIDGETLQSFLMRRERRLPIGQALKITGQVSALLARIHGVGWVWRDCKPANLIITARGELRPVDFEGAGLARRRNSVFWQTPAFVPPPSGTREGDFSGTTDDLYALGVVGYFLVTGQLPDASARVPIRRLRRGVAKTVELIIDDLLNPHARLRPAASDVCQRLAQWI